MNFTLYELSNYNNANLIAKTFDCEHYKSPSQIKSDINKWLVPLKCEEFIIADYDNLPANFFTEYTIDFNALVNYISIDCELKRACFIYLYSVGYALDLEELKDKLDDLIIYEADSKHDLILQILEFFELDNVPSLLLNNLDIDGIYRELELTDGIEKITDNHYITNTNYI